MEQEILNQGEDLRVSPLLRISMLAFAMAGTAPSLDLMEEAADEAMGCMNEAWACGVRDPLINMNGLAQALKKLTGGVYLIRSTECPTDDHRIEPLKRRRYGGRQPIVIIDSKSDRFRPYILAELAGDMVRLIRPDGGERVMGLTTVLGTFYTSGIDHHTLIGYRYECRS